MQDVVAVAVKLENGETRYFLTWGRIHDSVDPKPLEEQVLAMSTRFALGARPIGARVCMTLQEAATQPYFYECFFTMSQKKIPVGPKYGDWAAATRGLMAEGKEIYFLGSPQVSGSAES